MIKRTVNIAKSFREAEQWDIQQQIKMTHEKRQKAARVLKERVFGRECPDVREVYPEYQKNT